MPTDPQDTVDALARLVRGEMAALSTYARALEKFSGQPEEATLRRIHGEHQVAHDRLVDLLADRGAPPPEDVGAFGHLAWAVHRLSTWINDELPIQLLQRGERIGVHAYEQALDDPSLTEVRVPLRAHLDGCHLHVAMLQQLREHVGEPLRPML
ncbi:MAG: hypothetical protein R3B09_11970 [Nannocystaceae bacterium]